jgi:integrase
LGEATVKNHGRYLAIFLNYATSAKGKAIETVIQDFMLEIKRTKANETYKNYLATLKILFRDYLKSPELISDFKFPQQQAHPKFLPSKQQLNTFFNALDPKYKIIFLALASSGLRISELLGAETDSANRMLIPKAHNGSTKKAWVSFYNEETEALLQQYQGNPFEASRNTVAHVFKEAANRTGIDISAQTLRSIFAREMGLKGVQDRHIDAFCGRTPASVLAKHYSDYSPEVLKAVYVKASIKIME